VSNTPLGFISQLPRPIITRALGIDTRADLRGARSCVTKDDRTPEQKQTHVLAIVARDKFLSGWGGARGGTSRCAWACHPDVNPDRLFNWVKSRSEMQRVALVDLRTYRPPAGTAAFHIYVCNPEHVGARY
jgi:hypothetical protein